MAVSAIIFDVDGTLLDSNAEHLKAWSKALETHGYEVSSDRIAVEIGKGGDKLVPSILGEQIERRHGKSLRKAQATEFESITKAAPVPLFPGAKLLLAELRGRGFKLALATSGRKDDLKRIQRIAGIDWATFFEVIVTSEDVNESKPSPAILDAAITKLGVSPAQCIMIGDTPYDADSARDSGAICLGVTCGGMNDLKTLRATGMRKVYRDPADILEHLDEALQIASPGIAILTQAMIESLMKQALAVARAGLDVGEVPIGCVIAKGDGTVIARGHNELNLTRDRTAHAEMVAFRRAAGQFPLDTRELILVSTLEPCVMCLGAAMESAVDTILYGVAAPMDGGTLRVRPPVSPESQMPRILGNVLAKESRHLLEEFLNGKSTNLTQLNFVRDLLKES